VSIIARRAATLEQLFFLKPLQLHLQLADLLIEFRDQWFLFARVAFGARVKHLRHAGEQLLLPHADLGGVDVIRGRDLRGREPLLDRLQRHFRFQDCTVLFSTRRHSLTSIF